MDTLNNPAELSQQGELNALPWNDQEGMIEFSDSLQSMLGVTPADLVPNVSGEPDDCFGEQL
jgi:hypothetical protein